MGTYTPSWWPADVELPGTPRFKASALAWLHTLVPEGYLEHEILRNHPVAVVSLARRMLIARYEAAREGYRTIHTELGERLPPHQVNEVRAAYLEEGQRLMDTARGLDLVDRAIRGERLTPKSPNAAPWFPPSFWMQA